MALVNLRIGVKLEARRLGLRHVLPAAIGVVGAVGLLLAVLHGIEGHWQTMGALEAVDGMLLFGISTAFIFAVMLDYWPMLARLHTTNDDPP